ncbi:MAG: VWA domain-containing protein [Candidatus Elarobacter sp.]
MKRTILEFLEAARCAGIPISVADGIDAFRAVDALGLTDRAALKDGLGLTVAKSRVEKELFERCFELYFARETFGGPATAEEPAESGASPASGGALADALRANDRGGLTLAIESAAARVGVARIRFPLQVNTFAQQVLQELGLSALEAEIARVRDDDPNAADDLTRRRDALRAAVRAFVERRSALAAPGEARWADDNLSRRMLWTLDRRDIERMRTIVRAMAKRLATRYGRDRRHRRRGHLDVRRTLRRNTAHDGVPFVTLWKRRRIERPRVFALCDVSGSVARWRSSCCCFCTRSPMRSPTCVRSPFRGA